MGLIYCGASVYSGAYNGNYLMHWRPVGSRNGISNTPGYKAKGELAKGKWINGVYVPADRLDTYGKLASGSSKFASAQLRKGDYGTAARFVGNAVKNYVRQAGSDIKRAADIAYNTTREFATGENTKAYLDSLVKRRNEFQRKYGYFEDPELNLEIERAQKLYDRTIPGMIDKAKYVGGQAWDSVKTRAGKAMEKARSFIDTLWGKAKELGGSAWKKIQPIANSVWSTIKTKGADALKWGKGMVDKVVGAVREFTTGQRSRSTMEDLYSKGYSREEAARMSGYNETIPGMVDKAKDVGKTLPGMVENTARQVGKNVETVSMNVGSALNGAAEATGNFITKTSFSVLPKSAQNAIIKDLAENATENMQKSRTAETDAERAEYEARAKEYQDKINILEGWRRK